MCVISTSQELDKALKWYQALCTLEVLIKDGATVRLERGPALDWRCIVTSPDRERIAVNYDNLGDALAGIGLGYK